MNLKEYDREINRRLFRRKMRKLGNYIDTHAWTHWAISAALVASFWAVVTLCYSAGNGGKNITDDFLDWYGAPKAEVSK